MGIVILYIGPGIGLATIIIVVVVLLIVLFSLLMIIWTPIKKFLLKAKRKFKNE
jgi:F0F1-type ATP synthase membrane subunit b/b'